MVDGWERVRELRRELKGEWARLWRTKYDDDVRAEDVSSRRFERLFVDRGEIINATRDYKPLSFRGILERHLGSEVAGRVDPDPAEGGWRKFARENLKRSRPPERRGRPEGRERPGMKADLAQPQRKGGRGWLNRARVWRKRRFSGYED